MFGNDLIRLVNGFGIVFMIQSIPGALRRVCVLETSYFTSNNNIAGYTCCLYENGIDKACLDLPDYIRATNITSAEKQALAWAKEICEASEL